MVLNSQLSRVEFLSAICEELHVALPEQRNSIKALTDVLNSFLLHNHSLGRRTILIVDEAQNLRLEVLEQVRLLTNLETAKQKLLQIILIGQPELREQLARNDMRQLAQRITGRYHLEPLSSDETSAYVDHRLKVAGAIGPIFTAAAKRMLFRHSGGVPRMINVIADRALLGGYTEETQQITPQLVREAVREVYDQPPAGFSWRRPWWAHPGGLARRRRRRPADRARLGLRRHAVAAGEPCAGAGCGFGRRSRLQRRAGQRRARRAANGERQRCAAGAARAAAG